MREPAELLSHIEELQRLRQLYERRDKPHFVRFIDEMIAEDERDLAILGHPAPPISQTS